MPILLPLAVLFFVSLLVVWIALALRLGVLSDAFPGSDPFAAVFALIGFAAAIVGVSMATLRSGAFVYRKARELPEEEFDIGRIVGVYDVKPESDEVILLKIEKAAARKSEQREASKTEPKE